MRILLPTTVLALLLMAGSVHPQSYDEPFDRGPLPPPDDRGPPPPPPRDMICYVQAPPPFVSRSCRTREGYPGSPCRCAGSFIEGIRDFAD